MTEFDELTTSPEQPTAEPEPTDSFPAARQSLADELREQYANNQRERTTEIDIPGFDGFVGIYRPLSEPERKAEVRRVEKIPAPEQAVIVAIDNIATCCVELKVRNDNGELEHPLDKDDPVPLRYDERLAEFLGFEAKSVREIVRKTFYTSGQFNPTALLVHADEIAEWMQSVSPEVDSAFEGE